MTLALDFPITSESSSEVIMEKTKDDDTIRIFGRDRPAQQKDFQSPAPITDNLKHSDEELIQISDGKMNSRQLMFAYGEHSGKIFILDNGDIAAEVWYSGFTINWVYRLICVNSVLNIRKMVMIGLQAQIKR
ncbi:MAG: hypothetical protein EZS28_054067 [Streblomastix strix]|uniref:Uncharacterized protein n=1 Tax=Streblomastix strix TaxID=222440 RepID=A0A5J4QUG7_9EUKA|nr:MAG: hypothetical protein EZS28_054067 [Streblomastix strix]